MSDAKGERDRRSAAPQEVGVLVNLPRTRPQRATPRRAAARKSAQTAQAASSAPIRTVDLPQGARGRPAMAGTAAKRAASTHRRPAAKRHRSAAPRPDAAPRQGYETDGETMTGSLRPPGGLELVGSAAEIVGELAKIGLSAGERVLKDAFSRLPRA